MLRNAISLACFVLITTSACVNRGDFDEGDIPIKTTVDSTAACRVMQSAPAPESDFVVEGAPQCRLVAVVSPVKLSPSLEGNWPDPSWTSVVRTRASILSVAPREPLVTVWDTMGRYIRSF